MIIKMWIFFCLHKDEQDQSRRQDCFVTYSGAFITAILIVTMRKNIYIERNLVKCILEWITNYAAGGKVIISE